MPTRGKLIAIVIAFVVAVATRVAWEYGWLSDDPVRLLTTLAFAYIVWAVVLGIGPRLRPRPLWALWGGGSLHGDSSM